MEECVRGNEFHSIMLPQNLCRELEMEFALCLSLLRAAWKLLNNMTAITSICGMWSASVHSKSPSHHIAYSWYIFLRIIFLRSTDSYGFCYLLGTREFHLQIHSSSALTISLNYNLLCAREVVTGKLKRRILYSYSCQEVQTISNQTQKISSVIPA